MTRVYADAQVTVELVGPLGPFENNAYIVRPMAGGAATVVDAPAGAEAIVEALGGAAVERIVVTHSHRDHWDGFGVLRAHTQAPVFASERETELDPAHGVQPLADGAAFAVGGAQVEVLHTPGHTPGSICLRVGGALLTGDTLFPGGPGHSRSPEALQQAIAAITGRLYPLPEATLVLPGHGAGTTIGASRAEYAVFAAKAHPADLHGDVLWLES
ncbi:MAG: MBL fold metallo-hydrolase [Chloroflexi bacterium]|nr:MBL fold metallo-hydrolase [Chloroflexota bacterium]